METRDVHSGWARSQLVVTDERKREMREFRRELDEKYSESVREGVEELALLYRRAFWSWFPVGLIGFSIVRRFQKMLMKGARLNGGTK